MGLLRLATLLLFLTLLFAGCSVAGHGTGGPAQFVSITPSPGYYWRQESGGEGEVAQSAVLPGGQQVNIYRTGFRQYSAQLSAERLHTLELWLITFRSEPPNADSEAILRVISKAQAKHVGEPIEPFRSEIVNLKNFRCNHAYGRDRVKGSRAFPNETFDFRMSQYDCYVPSRPGVMFRIQFSERMRFGTPSAAERVLPDVLDSLKVN